MIEYKNSTSARVPVRLLTTLGNPVSNVPYTAVTASIEKSDGSVVTLTLSNNDWVEVASGAFSGTGKYDLIIPDTATNLSGMLVYAIQVTGAEPYLGVVKIVTNEEADTKSIVDHMRRLMEGKWEIQTTGVDANKLILYSSDGTTPLQKWELYDKDGSPSTTNVYARIPTVAIP